MFVSMSVLHLSTTDWKIKQLPSQVKYTVKWFPTQLAVVSAHLTCVCVLCLSLNLSRPWKSITAVCASKTHLWRLWIPNLCDIGAWAEVLYSENTAARESGIFSCWKVDLQGPLQGTRIRGFSGHCCHRLVFWAFVREEGEQSFWHIPV